MQLKKNIKLGIINFLIYLILLVNISYVFAQEDLSIKNNILIEINVLDKVSSKNTILKLKIGEEKKISKFVNQSIKM